MVNNSLNEYHPDSVSAPGETLLETLDTIGMPQAELARRMGRPVKTINEIIQGKTVITAETALQLEQVLRIPASFWLKREQRYQEFLARLAEEPRLAMWVDWLNEFPVEEMTCRGWLPPVASKSRQVFALLRFFGVASPEAWQAIWEDQAIKYRKSPAFTGQFGAMTAWLRQGEIQAQEIDVKLYKAEAFRNALQSIRSLTGKPVSVVQGELVRLCAEAGVAVVLVQALSNTGICGAAQWVTSTKALVQLRLRYQTDDQFWFTFFHEAGHILLHGKRRIFVDWETRPEDGEKAEKQANAFAAKHIG